MAFTRETGDDDHRGIGEVLRIFNQLIAVVLYRRLRKIPVLCRDGYGSAVRCKGCIKINQFLVYLKSGILNAFDQAHFCIKIIDAAGTRSSVNRVGRGPAEKIDLFRVFQRKDAFIFQQDKSFFCNFQSVSGSFLRKFFRNNSRCGCCTDKVEQCRHRPEADQVYNEDDCQQSCHPGLAANKFFLLFGELFHCYADNYGSDQCCSDGDKVRCQPFQDADQVFHFKRDHGRFPFCYSRFAGFLCDNTTKNREKRPIHISIFLLMVDRFRKTVYNIY